MAVELKNVARLAVRVESAFGADESGETFLDVPAREMPSVTLTRPQLAVQAMQQHIHSVSPTVLGPRSAELSFDILLAGVGGSSTTSPAVADSALLTILDAVFGGSDVANANGAADGTGTASAFGASSAPGGADIGAVGWVNAAGILEARSISAITSSLVTVHNAMSAAPADGDAIVAASTFYADGGNADTLQFLIEDESGRYLLRGCQLTGAPRLTMTLGELPMLSLTFSAATWTRLSSASVTAATYAQSPDYVDGGFRVRLGSTTYALDVSSVEYTLRGPTYMPIASPNGVDTVAGYKMMRSPEGIGDVAFAFPVEDDVWEDAWHAGSYVHIEHQAGTASRKAWLAEVPRAQIIDWQRVDEGGASYQRVTVRATTDSESVPAALRLHHV